MMETKICSECKKEKSTIDFYKDKNRKDGFMYYCKKCVATMRRNRFENKRKIIIYNKKCSECKEVKSVDHFNTCDKSTDCYSNKCIKCEREYSILKGKNKIIISIYHSQIASSKQRNYPPPTYTKEELKEWLFNNPKFHKLYNNWEKSGFLINLKPSIDRIDDYESYTLDNIQLMTWKENHYKACNDRKNGINNKASKAVLQFDLEGNFIKEYYSERSAARKTGVAQSSIWQVLNGKYNHAGGYFWKYKD